VGGGQGRACGARDRTRCMPCRCVPLSGQVLAAGAKVDDPRVSPVVRQTLQHWAYVLTEEDLQAFATRGGVGAYAYRKPAA
jgi:hypothetical protein